MQAGAASTAAADGAELDKERRLMDDVQATARATARARLRLRLGLRLGLLLGPR